MSEVKVDGNYTADSIMAIVEQIIMVNTHTSSTSQRGMKIMSRPKPLVFDINTSEGYFNNIWQWWNMLPVLQYMERSKVDIACVVTSKCYNAFTFMLITATPGYRYMYEHAEITIEPIKAFGGSWNTKASQEDENSNQRQLAKYVHGTFKKYTTIPKAKLDRLFLKSMTFTAQEAKRYGFIDHILRSGTENVYQTLMQSTSS